MVDVTLEVVLVVPESINLASVQSLSIIYTSPDTSYCKEGLELR